MPLAHHHEPDTEHEDKRDRDGHHCPEPFDRRAIGTAFGSDGLLPGDRADVVDELILGSGIREWFATKRGPGAEGVDLFDCRPEVHTVFGSQEEEDPVASNDRCEGASGGLSGWAFERDTLTRGGAFEVDLRVNGCGIGVSFLDLGDDHEIEVGEPEEGGRTVDIARGGVLRENSGPRSEGRC